VTRSLRSIPPSTVDISTNEGSHTKAGDGIRRKVARNRVADSLSKTASQKNDPPNYPNEHDSCYFVQYDFAHRSYVFHL
jgi:hypothetical protein